MSGKKLVYQVIAMSDFKRVYYNCKKAQELGLKMQAKQKISVRSWFAMRYHLFFCKYCRWFLRQSRVIDKAIATHKELIIQKLETHLSNTEKDALQQQINSQNKG